MLKHLSNSQGSWHSDQSSLITEPIFLIIIPSFFKNTHIASKYVKQKMDKSTTIVENIILKNLQIDKSEINKGRKDFNNNNKLGFLLVFVFVLDNSKFSQMDKRRINSASSKENIYTGTFF